MSPEALQLHKLLEAVKLENDESDVTAIYTSPEEVKQEGQAIEQAIIETGASI